MILIIIKLIFKKIYLFILIINYLNRLNKLKKKNRKKMKLLKNRKDIFKICLKKKVKIKKIFNLILFFLDFAGDID